MSEKMIKAFLVRRKVNSNGTVSIPKTLRRELRLDTGDVVYFNIPVDQKKAKEKYEGK